MTLTAGQRQALGQLEFVAARGGGLTIVHVDASGDSSTGGTSDVGIDSLAVDIVIDCRGVPHADGGIALRAFERLRLHIPTRFPFDLPRVETPHRRWASHPHVQFGSQLCLYRSRAVEWNPGDAMFGFIDRLLDWLERAAAGTLDAPGEPIHPPVAYTLGGGTLVVRASAPTAENDSPWFGGALVRATTGHYGEVVAWHRLGDGSWIQAAQDASDRLGVPVYYAAAVVLPDGIGFEFPRLMVALLRALHRQGAGQALTLGLIGLAASINDALSRLRTDGAAPAGRYPLEVIIGTPSRGIVGETPVTHLAAWRVPGDVSPLLSAVTDDIVDQRADAQRVGQSALDRASEWVRAARVDWLTVYEMRPEVTVRRDAGTPAAWLAGRRVLVLGAGALGAPIAEACVRGGAAAVSVADSGSVHPGIIIRQPYDEPDIGRAKANVLSERLSRIREDLTVVPIVGDVTTTMFGPSSGIPAVDLIVDATADRTVRHVIEARRQRHRDTWPAHISVMIGADARRGLATVSLPGASGGSVDILRRLALELRADETGRVADLLEDFYPDPPRGDLFQPEPGCSDATFRGGAPELAGLAGQLFSGALVIVAGPADPRETMHALGVRMPAAEGSAPHPGPHRWSWPSDHVQIDQSGRYEVRISAAALAEMYAECRRGLRVRGREIETGGVLLGQFDDAANVVWVDLATGPPPDSLLSAVHFQHGSEGVAELVAARLAMSCRTSGFVGMWHSHPDGRAAPSPTDERGMASLIAPVSGGPRRAVLLILGGASSAWTTWLDRGQIPPCYIRVVDRADRLPNAAQPTVEMAPLPDAERWWLGGYGTTTTDEPQRIPHGVLAIPNGWWRRAVRPWGAILRVRR